MPIFAYTPGVVNTFTALPHDLFFDVPEDGFQVIDGKFVLRLTDQEQYLNKARVSVFHLTVHDVLRMKVDGDPKSGPGHDMLNEIKFDEKHSILSLKCCMAIRKIDCHVSKLHLELNELA